MEEHSYYKHESAIVHPDAEIGDKTRIWHWAHVREGAKIGKLCVVSMGVYIDKDVQIGDYTKIQNYVPIYHGVTIGEGVFIGPHVCFTNDLYPRAVNEKFEPATDDDWELASTQVKKGASIGANSTIIAGHTIGEWALVAAGSVVTRDVEPHTLVMGNPARTIAEVNERGRRLK